MPIDFTELDYQQTPLGDLILRRRRIPALDNIEVYEVKLGDEFLMSSLFSAGEIALAELGLVDLPGTQLDIIVGGLGLGYTAWAALEKPEVSSMLVIEALSEVISWHQQGLVPLGLKLSADPRCRFINDNFFALADLTGSGFDPQMPGRRFHAILLDIDHSPRHLLNPSHGLLYTPAGLQHLTTYLHPGGVFALWSNDPPDADFLADLQATFATAKAQVVTFPNPLQNNTATNTIYLAYHT